MSKEDVIEFQNRSREEAKKVLANFAKSLDGVKQIEFEEQDFIINVRIEGVSEVEDNGFREIFFENAPLVSGNSIIGEKKKW